ncbi:MAG TPA: zinc ribbon domain-containing protein [Pyrinomonadaceae bacterium]|nr:zinc ribbon domain-containing protein [Pyrinomonadaceae bacterium]
MFCPNCGTEATPGLNYCKRCGGNLNQSLVVQESHPVALSVGSAWAIGVTTLVLVLGALGVLMGATVALVEHGVPPKNITLIALFGAATILGSVGLLMRLWTTLLRGQSRALTSKMTAQLPTPKATLSELHQTRSVVGAALPDYVPSVSEHTTRAFDPVRRDEGRGMK